MVIMDSDTMNAIYDKAEKEMPADAKIGVVAATDTKGLDIEAVLRLNPPGSTNKFDLVGAYHHAFTGDPSSRDEFGLMFHGFIF